MTVQTEPIQPKYSKQVVKTLDYKHFDVLNPKYEILQFGNVLVRKKIRYGKKWLTKCGSDWAFAKIKGIGRVDYNITEDKFVLIVKNSPLDFSY